MRARDGAGASRATRGRGRRGWVLSGLLLVTVLGGCRGDDPDGPPADAVPGPSPDAAVEAAPSPESPGSGEAAERPSARPGDPPRPLAPDRVLEGVFSPDGLRLAVTWDRGAGARIHGLLAGTDSTPPAPARGLPLSAGRGAWATWSPDGLWIAYGSGGRLRRMRPDGTGDEPVPGAPAGAAHPDWSPSGDRLALVAPREPGSEPVPWIMGADGSGAAPVPVPVEGPWRAPAWHPSGSWLVAEASSGEGSAVFRLDPERGSAVRLARGGSPAFGPAGEALWYARRDSIFRIPVDAPGGPGQEELVLPRASAPRPAPDGRRLAFTRGNRGSEGLYLLHLETGALHRLTEPPPEDRR
jgi:Tol biopolymer transport system component